MSECDQERIWIEVMVDRDLVAFSMQWPVVAVFSCTAFCNPYMNVVLDYPTAAGINTLRGKILR